MIDVIRAAWSRETSYWPETWTSGNPAHGQCAITALVVQDHFGGDIWRGWVGTDTHYWNHIDGRTVDLTLEQFPAGSEVRRDVPVHRDVILRNEDTRRRYELLSERIAALKDSAHDR